MINGFIIIRIIPTIPKQSILFKWIFDDFLVNETIIIKSKERVAGIVQFKIKTYKIIGKRPNKSKLGILSLLNIMHINL